MLTLAIFAAGIWGVITGFRTSPVNWFVVGLEAVITVAGAIGVMHATASRRGFREGPAIGLVCVAGAVLVCAGLSFITLNAGFRGIQRDPFFLARTAAGCGLLALAAVAVLLRKPSETFRPLLVGVVMGVLAAATAAPLVLPGTRKAIQAAHPVVESLTFLIAGVLLIGFVSASTHLIIKAFDRGRIAGEAAGDAARA